MGRGGKTALSRDERVLCDRLRQITPQSRLLRVDEAVHMLRDMYAEYRRRTVASLTELVRRATDAIAADFVPRPVARVPVPAIPAAQEPAQPAPTRAPSTPSPAPGASSGASAAPSPAPPSSTASSPAPAAQPPRDAAAEARAREKRLEEAGSVLNRALVERYKAVCTHTSPPPSLCVCVISHVVSLWFPSSTNARGRTRAARRRSGRSGCGAR